MRLSALLKDVETRNVYIEDCEITCVTDSTEKIRRNCAFVCLCGDHSDGHDFAELAVSKGAAVVICEREVNAPNTVLVPDCRAAYALMCANFYGRCSEKMKLIGITGTNGKTTTAYLLRDVLEKSGMKTGLIGTVKVMIGNEEFPADLTTPDPADLHRYLMMMYNAGCTACVAEVSSQALSQKRVHGLDFDCAVFTNLSPEHLDYHKTLESYAEAKAKLFEISRTAVINDDDPHARLMRDSCRGRVVSFGTDSGDFVAKNISLRQSSVSYDVDIGAELVNVSFGMPGGFSVYNSLAALTAAHTLGVDVNTAVDAISRFGGIPGRMERVPNSLGIDIIIDFAHTPASLENVLKTLRAFCFGRLITVFGCGGDRDKEKRPLMGKNACDYSDIVFVTSDNPRTEEPTAIINDITGKLEKNNYYKITDRTLAIKSAVLCAKAGDTVLIAGKGHEKYQISGTQKIYYDEREKIRKLLEDKARF